MTGPHSSSHPGRGGWHDGEHRHHSGPHHRPHPGSPWHDRGWRGGYDYGYGSPGPALPARARLWLPVVVSLLAQLSILSWQLWRAREVGAGEVAVALALTVAGPLALVLARRLPGPVVAVVAAIALLDLLVNPGLSAGYVALAFAIVLAIVRGARVWAFASVAAAWLAAVVGASILGIDWHPARIIVTTLGLLLVLGIGESIRSRRARFVELRQQATRRRTDAAQQERVRIARELHDVLAHSLSQINVQAGVGLHLLDSQPEKAAEALASIKSTSKQALDEVRGVLGILRSDDPATASSPLVPEADLARLPVLVDSLCTSELTVTLDDHVETPPSAGVQLALYRIAQEGLTNVVRHSAASTARVELFETAESYVLRVTDDGTGVPSGAAEAGTGLLGMRERAELLGGHLDAGNRDGGGFGVTATIPRRPERRAS